MEHLQHLSTEQRAQGRRNKLLLTAFVFGVGIFATVALIIAVVTTDPPDVRVLADQGHIYVDGPVPDYVYNTLPPASGPHIPQLIPTGEHTQPIPAYMQLHHLETGGVIIHYNCPDGCPAIVAELRDILAEVGEDQLVLQPYPEIQDDHRIVVTAWTRWMDMETVDRQRIIDFIAEYRGIDHRE